MTYIRLIVLLSLTAMGVATAQAQTLNEPLRDPTRPPPEVRNSVAGKSHKPLFRIDSIMNGEHHRLAIINGKRVQEGDQVQGAKVVKIRRDSVTLSWQGQQERYRMKKPLNKQWLN